MAESEALAFGSEQVKRLTGLSTRQLRYWEDTGFFRSDYAGDRTTRIYSFRDLVGLYTVARLRKEYRLPLQKLRQIGEYLHTHASTPWASLGFYVQRGGRRVSFRDPQNPEQFLDLVSRGQGVMPVNMDRIADDVRERVREMRRRRPEQLGQVEKRRHVVRNAMVVAGTRVPTEAVWSFHVAGYRTEQILREFPTLTRQDVDAAIKYEAAHRKPAAG